MWTDTLTKAITQSKNHVTYNVVRANHWFAIYFLPIWTYHFIYGCESDRQSEPIIYDFLLLHEIVSQDVKFGLQIAMWYRLLATLA